MSAATTTKFCFDCETDISGDQVVCDSCKAHRSTEGDHDPAPVEWCHGAGPDGTDLMRMLQVPRALTKAERTWD